MAKYSYTRIPGTNLCRPIITISIGNPKTRKETPPIQAIIDSGADICLAAKDIAVWLGIHFGGNEETVSIMTANGSTSRAVKKDITLITTERRHICPFFFVEDTASDRKPLLGQHGFFDHFRICFELKNTQFEIF